MWRITDLLGWVTVIKKKKKSQIPFFCSQNKGSIQQNFLNQVRHNADINQMFTAKSTVGTCTVKKSRITDLSKPAHFNNPWWHVAIDGSHPIQNQSPDQSKGQCVNMLLTQLLSLCDFCLPVAQIQCKQPSTNKCKYLKVSLANAWACQCLNRWRMKPGQKVWWSRKLYSSSLHFFGQAL